LTAGMNVVGLHTKNL